jgi:rod shape-determining protein MreD
MLDPQLWHRWALRTAYVLAALLLIFFQLLPLDTAPDGWVGPDLLLALTFGIAARRPEYLPALAVAGVMLLADLLLQRPPGLMALLVVLGAEALKARARGLRDRNFPVEWMTVAVVLLAILTAQRLVLAVLMVPQAALTLTLMQALVTLAAYPFVVLAAHLVMGVTKPHPADIDSEGRRA